MNTVGYLNLSALAYVNFSATHKGKSIGALIEEYEVISKDDLNKKPEFSSLQDPSNPLRSYKLINFEKNDITGFAAAAFQSPSGEIVFAFRGTETTKNGIPVWNDAATDAIIGLTVLPPLQAQNVLDFAQSTVAKLTNNKDISINRSLQYLKNNNATATGHSLGGGLASYLTHATSNLDTGGSYGGIKSVTFNAVGIGHSLPKLGGVARLKQYNVTDHVNSLDWVCS